MQSYPQRMHVSILTSHVLFPVRQMADLLNTEYEEIQSEIELFNAFCDAISSIESVQSAEAVPQVRIMHASNNSTNKIISEYKRTVFSYDQYRQEYDETLQESMVNEFGRDVVTLLCADNTTRLTPGIKKTVLSSAEECIYQRDRLCTRIEAEITALEAVLDQLTTLVGSLNRVKIPSWYADGFTTEVEEMLLARQGHLHEETPGFDRHKFYGYLTNEYPWTYPVLTAIARLREAVFIET